MNVYDATIKYLPHVNTSGILSVQREYSPVLVLIRFGMLEVQNCYVKSLFKRTHVYICVYINLYFVVYMQLNLQLC